MSGINNSNFKILPTRKDPIVQRNLAERVLDKDYIKAHEQVKALKERDYFKEWLTTYF